MEYSFSAKRWLTKEQIDSDVDFPDEAALGLHPPGVFSKIVHLNKCHLQTEVANEIRNFIFQYAIKNELSFFNYFKQTGILRTLIIRNTSIDEYMVTVVFNEYDEIIADELLNTLDQQFDIIKSVYYVINTKANDSLLDQEFILYSGQTHIFEQLGKIKYGISPKSFFQTNSYQAKVLYDIIKEFADLQNDDTVYDLFSGTGSIGLYLAEQAKEIIGIESVDEAVKDARYNAALNNINNSHFYTGDVKDVFDAKLVQKHGSPDCIILDPPRAGIHEDALRFILTLNAKKIVYVSCNPATQARDLNILSEKYNIAKSVAVDMFPQTNHVENVVLIEIK